MECEIIQDITLSIVIPAYNEEAKIGGDIEQAFTYLEHQPYDAEVIVVDDGSADRTSEVAKSFQDKYSNLRVIRYEKNKGKGFAVRTGILNSRGQFILFADAGACVPYGDLEKGMKMLRDGYDMAIGSRGIEGSTIKKSQPLFRQLGARVFRWIVHRLMGVKGIEDTQCGFKLFKSAAAQAIFNRNRIDGFMFDTETILNAHRLGFRLSEFPVSWSNDPDSRFNPISGSLKNLKELLMIRLGI